jgi:hypothetical protein
MESPHSSKVLLDYTLNGLLIGLGFHDYRQFIKAVLRIILGIDYDNGGEGKVEANDAAFGHLSGIGLVCHTTICRISPVISLFTAGSGKANCYLNTLNLST